MLTSGNNQSTCGSPQERTCLAGRKDLRTHESSVRPAQGRDIYAFTAPLVVEATQRILDGAAEGAGVLAPGEMFDAPGFLRALAPDYLSFESKDTEVMSQKC